MGAPVTHPFAPIRTPPLTRLLVAPRILTPEIRSFCRALVGVQAPVFLENEPSAWPEAEDCYAAVDDQVRRHGGAACFGWRIWEWPRTLLEAEFHCVWRNPEGGLRDIAPTKMLDGRILFVADAVRTFTGTRIGSRQHPLRSGIDVSDFIAACEAEFELLERGDRATQFGRVTLQGDEAEEYRRILARKLTAEISMREVMPTPGRNEACPCGNGKKYKRCHGANL